MENTQKQLAAQERIEELADIIIDSVEGLERKGIAHVVNNEFSEAECTISILESVSKLLATIEI